MFPDLQPTPFDLTFRLFGFPVRVHPLFWLGMALLGSNLFNRGFELGLIWVVCGFVSILAHELGHAVVIRRYGSPASIWLFAFGGVAIPSYTPASAWRRLAIALAGPAAGFLLLGLLWGTNELFGWATAGAGRAADYLKFTFEILIDINLIWSLLNLLPIWPLDGGRACQELLTIGGHRRPLQAALWVSVATAAGLAAYGILLYVRLIPNVLAGTWLSWVAPGPIWTIFLILLAAQSYMMLQQVRRGPRLYSGDDDRLPWEKRG